VASAGARLAAEQGAAADNRLGRPTD
jgi:hypothetical protein